MGDLLWDDPLWVPFCVLPTLALFFWTNSWGQRAAGLLTIFLAHDVVGFLATVSHRT